MAIDGDRNGEGGGLLPAPSPADGTGKPAAGQAIERRRSAVPSAEVAAEPAAGGAWAMMSAARPSAPDQPAEQLLLESGLGFRLSRLTRTLRADWARELDELGLTTPQAAVLRGVAGRPGCSLRSLARTLGAEPMRAKRCVDDLEGRGLLTSAHRGADRRPRVLDLTADGRALARRVDTLVRRQEQRLDKVLGPDRRARLEGALAALEAGLSLLPAARAPATAPTGEPGPAASDPPRARPDRPRYPRFPTKEQR